MYITISDYLDSRQFNRKLIRNAGKELAPHIERFANEHPELNISANWCMSAKRQRGQLIIKINNNASEEAVQELAIFAQDDEGFTTTLEKWFDSYDTYDEPTVRTNYIVIDLGF